MLTVINFLFNPVLWYVLLGIAGAVIITILCFKYSTARWITATVLTLALLGSTIYSSVQLNIYYSAEGGIYGYISSLLKKNQVEVVDGMNFKLSEVHLTSTTNNNEFIAEFDIDKVYHFDQKTNYGLMVNGFPVSNVFYSATSISGDFNYNFYSETNDLILSDNLFLNISFNTKNTHITLRTQGGGEALKYWNIFFSRNEFLIEIISDGYINS